MKPDKTGKFCELDYSYILKSVEECNGEFISYKRVTGYINRLKDMTFSFGYKCRDNYELKRIRIDDPVPDKFRYLYFDELLRDSNLREKMKWAVVLWQDAWLINGFYDGWSKEFYQTC